MRRFKRAYYGATSLLPMAMLNKLTRPTTLFPYHHLVSDAEVMHVKHLYPYKNVRQFKNDLDYLLKNLKPVSLEDLMSSLQRSGKLPEKSFLLSFDDGFRELYDVVEPILSAKGVPAVLFINPAFVDNKELFYRSKISLLIEELSKPSASNTKQAAEVLQCKDDFESLKTRLVQINNLDKEILDRVARTIGYSFDEYLTQHKPFLDMDQLHSLKRKGYAIGAHSWDHPYYNTLSREGQLDQTIRSCSYVQQHFAPDYCTFSFPHFDSRLDQGFFDELLGGSFHVDLLFGTQNQKRELHNRMVHRFNAERPDLPMEKQLKGVLVLMYLQKLLKKDLVTRVRLSAKTS